MLHVAAIQGNVATVKKLIREVSLVEMFRKKKLDGTVRLEGIQCLFLNCCSFEELNTCMF